MFVAMARNNGLLFIFLLALSLLPFASVGALAQVDHGARPSAEVTVAERRAAEGRQLALARTLLNAEQWDKAIEVFVAAAAATNVDIAAAARVGLSQAAAGKKAYEEREAAMAAARKLEMGRTFLSAGDWAKATEALQDAAAAKDDVIAANAREGLAAVNREKQAAPLGVRVFLPPPFSRCWLIDYILIALFTFVAVRVVMRVFERKNDWKVSVAGTAKEELRNSVFDEFIVTMRELRRHGHDDAGLSAVGGGKTFYTPLSLSDLVGPNVQVQGVDLTRIASMIQSVSDHYSYRFELRVDTIEERAYVFAQLRRRGRSEKVWQVPMLADKTVHGYREIGRHLAFLVYGDDLVRT